jgi:phage terminase large subunit
MPKEEVWQLRRPIPRWAMPLQKPARFKGAYGGRASGKSHEMATMAVEAMVRDPDLRIVCIREVQRSLKYSAKSLIEHKIHSLGVDHLFEIMRTEIRHRMGSGVMIFEGMQDHTADSIKSLEGFGRAWVEEAQNLSKRSLNLLIPTIRKDGSEIWFTWNPELPNDPVDELLIQDPPEGAVVVQANFMDNPWVPDGMIQEAKRMRRVDPDAFSHIWEGNYNLKSEAQVLAGKWRVDEFRPLPTWDGPYYGMDWGFSQDPTVLVRGWRGDDRLWLEYCVGAVGVEMDQLPTLLDKVPGAREHVIRCDPSRPETIRHMANFGFKTASAPAWRGSVEDGISWLRSHEEIIIHPRCKLLQDEARLWSYAVDRYTGDPMPKLASGNDHAFDATRYAFAPFIQSKISPGFD